MPNIDDYNTDNFNDSVPLSSQPTPTQFLNVPFEEYGFDLSSTQLQGPYAPEHQNAVNAPTLALINMLQDPTTYSELEWNQNTNRLLLAFEGITGERGEQTNSMLQTHMLDTVVPLGNELGFEVAVPSLAQVPWSVHNQLVSSPTNVTYNGVPINEAADEINALRNQVTGKTTTGSTSPVYNAPDRRTVEELVRAHLRVKTARVDEPNVQRLTDMYMSDHAADWNSRKGGGPAIDPEMTVVSEIRKQPDYISIHKNRPETANEDQWIGQQTASFEQQGLGAAAAEERGRLAASVGGRGSTVAVQQQQSMGTSVGFIEKAQGVASVIGNLVR